MRASIDIETALYSFLTGDGYSASAHALPATLGEVLPHIHVTRTGGYTTDRVIETNNVDFDVYAADQADAMLEASNLCGYVRSLELSEVETFCYSSEILVLPYNNPDPRHPNLGRVTFKAQLLTRTAESAGPHPHTVALVADDGETLSVYA